MARDAIKLGVILAGGRGRRMGGKNKADIRLGGRRLADLAVARLCLQVDRIIFSAPVSLDHNIPNIPDEASGIKGPLAGLLAAFRWGRKNLEGPFTILTVAVDTPFFPADLAARLCAGGGPALAACLGKVQTTFGLWPQDMEADLRAYAKEADNPSIRGFARKRKVPLVNFENPEHFFNINTPEDLLEAEKLV
ncbi:MAG: NTP transferase domain-containing protein [Proteobacteria bacterium]|nr:NTP transferase domain-containing protein [Pseudomonadota bacterium]